MSTATLSNYQANPVRFDTATFATGRVKLEIRQGSSGAFQPLSIIMPMLTALLSTGSDVNVHKSLDLVIIMSVHGASASSLTIRGIAPLTSKVYDSILEQTALRGQQNKVLSLSQLLKSYIMHKTDDTGDAPTFKVTLGSTSDCYFIGYLIDVHCSTSLISPLLLNYLIQFLGDMISTE